MYNTARFVQYGKLRVKYDMAYYMNTPNDTSLMSCMNEGKMLWQWSWLDLCTEEVVSARTCASQFLPYSLSGITLFGLRTVQADSCLNSEQIDTLFISVGVQGGGGGGGILGFLTSSPLPVGLPSPPAFANSFLSCPPFWSASTLLKPLPICTAPLRVPHSLALHSCHRVFSSVHEAHVTHVTHVTECLLVCMKRMSLMSLMSPSVY